MTLTPSEVGEFHNAALEYFLEYPDITDYPRENQAQVALSTFRKLEIVDSAIPYQPFLDAVDLYYNSSDFHDLLDDAENNETINSLQRGFLEEAFDELKNYGEGNIKDDVFF